LTAWRHAKSAGSVSTWGPGTGLAHTNYNVNAPTPRFAQLFKPIPNVTTYASYAQALQGGDTAPSAAANANAVLPPSVSQQYEVSVKAAVGDVNLSLALFRIDKVNAELNPTNNVYMQDGREIHQGIEAMATGRLTPELTLIGGFTLLDAYVANASALPATNGKIPVNESWPRYWNKSDRHPGSGIFIADSER
jgi:iron complex outermembrane recepter protein